MALRDTLTGFFGQKALTAADYAETGPILHNNHPGQRLTHRSARAHLSAYAGNDAIDWVMDCVTLIAETTSNAEYHFERNGKTLVPNVTQQQKGDTNIEEAPQDLVKILEHPNPWMDYVEMMELTVIDFLLTGNSYWLKFKPDPKTGKPRSLYRLPPPLITVVPGEQRPIDRYEYLPPGAAQPLTYQPEEILHIRRPNPHSQHFGAGVIAGGPRMFDAEIALTASFGGYFERGTRLSGIIESERSIPDKLWRKIVREFRQMFSRNENSWDVAALERGLTYRPLSATAAQAEYGALIPLSRDRICAAFRVPPTLLGFGASDVKSIKEDQRIFDNKTMRPFLNKLQTSITAGLTQAWGVDFHIDHEYVLPVEDKFQMSRDFATLPGVKIREVRDRVGLPPLGDARDDIVLNLPGDNTNASTVKDRAIGSEPGRPPNPKNTAAFPAPGKPAPADAQVSGPAPTAAVKK